MSVDDPLDELGTRLPHHAALLRALRRLVLADVRLRWLELGCSLGGGGGDGYSDADVAIGHTGITGRDPLDEAALSIASAIGPPIEMIAHRMDGWTDDYCRVAAQYDSGVQLDLVLMPAATRPGLPDRTLALVDKDHQLADLWVPDSRGRPSFETAREWVVLGWWALMNAHKYIARDSLFEATDAIAEARRCALQLWAAGRGVDCPSFGLVSLLDFPPFEVPHGLADCYCIPDDADAVVSAAVACAALMDAAIETVNERLGLELHSALADLVDQRLNSR